MADNEAMPRPPGQALGSVCHPAIALLRGVIRQGKGPLSGAAMKRLNPARPARPWRREHCLWLVLFSGVAAFGGIHMLYLALSSQDGPVLDDYYKRGLEINRASRRDWKAACELAADIALNSALEEVTISRIIFIRHACASNN